MLTAWGIVFVHDLTIMEVWFLNIARLFFTGTIAGVIP